MKKNSEIDVNRVQWLEPGYIMVHILHGKSENVVRSRRNIGF